MLGFLSSRCPLDAREKTWVELRMQWLAERLGFERLRTVEVLTPTDRHFPEDYHGTDADVERIFHRVREWMGIDRNTVCCEMFSGSRPSSYLVDDRGTALGLYQQRDDGADRHKIWIERSQARDPMMVVATVAHELAHSILLGENLLTSADADHEFVTDLLPIACGLGIFPANAAIILENHQMQRGSWQSVTKAGYLPARMFGYALAVFAWLRDERRPEWRRHLRGDSRSVLKAGLRYLYRTGECLCRERVPGERNGPRDLRERLASESPGIFLSALWELRRPGRDELTTDEWAAVVKGLDRRDPLLVCETALAIAALHRPDSAVVDRCLHLLERFWGNSSLRSALALVLGVQQDRIDLVIDELSRLLEDEAERVVIAALTSLRHLGPVAESIALRPILQVLRKGLVDCNDFLVTHAVTTLRAVCAAPQKAAAEFFEHDAELKMHAHEALRSEVDAEALFTTRLPTATSLPVPLPDWRPTPVLLDSERPAAPLEQVPGVP